MGLTAPTQLARGAREVGLEASRAPTLTDVLVPDEGENPLVLPHARHVLAPSQTALHGEHCVLASDLMAMRGVRECVSLDTGPHKTVVGYFHKHLK